MFETDCGLISQIMIEFESFDSIPFVANNKITLCC